MVTNGMILIGDVAGLESTELCDGVPAAWFSAEAAAKVAIEAIQVDDVSKKFLKKYETEIRNHPVIEWSISGRNRYNLRFAQEEHDLKKLKKYIHNGWGLGALSSFTSPFLQILLPYLNKDPTIISKWIKMYFRYFQNWLHESYDFSQKRVNKVSSSKAIRKKEKKFLRWMRVINVGLKAFRKMKKILKPIMVPLSHSINTFLKGFLPIFEPIYFALLKLTRPIRAKMGNKLIDFVDKANPSIFEVHS
jgi:hypothetical protein